MFFKVYVHARSHSNYSFSAKYVFISSVRRKSVLLFWFRYFKSFRVSNFKQIWNLVGFNASFLLGWIFLKQMRIYTIWPKAFVWVCTFFSIFFFSLKLKIIMSLVKVQLFSSWLCEQQVSKISLGGKSTVSAIHSAPYFIEILLIRYFCVFCCNLRHLRRAIQFDRIRNLIC